MNKFFTTDEVYKERMSICKKCVYYFSPTGQCKRCLCFMRIKSRIATLDCPEKYWLRTEVMETPEDLPEHIIEEVIKIYPDIENGRAKNNEVKRKMITLYNTVYNTKYSTGTNCRSCLNNCLEGIRLIYEKYK